MPSAIRLSRRAGQVNFFYLDELHTFLNLQVNAGDMSAKAGAFKLGMTLRSDLRATTTRQQLSRPQQR